MRKPISPVQETQRSLHKCAMDAYIDKGAVVLIGFSKLYAIHHVHTFNDLAKNGILRVEMRCSPYLLIDFAHFRRESEDFFCGL